MDLATVIGFLLCCVAMVFGAGGPSGIPTYVDMPSVFITLVGAFSGTIMAFPGSKILNCMGVAKNALLIKKKSPVETISQIIEFAEQARREGILALESRALEITDDFMKQGIQLAVDGTEPDLIKVILETEIAYMEERHLSGIKIFDYLGAAGPAFGMLGTLFGLVAMLGNMSDIDSLGPNMATTLITTLYGSLLANMFCSPIAEKLKLYSAQEVLIKTLMLEGIMSLQSGDNPRIVEQKLSVFLEPSMRAAVSKEKK
jgi:chemotaxis protein MotA